MKQLLFFFPLAIVFFVSCSSEIKPELVIRQDAAANARIPAEEALRSLDSFLAEIEADFTKSSPRRIASLDTLSNHRRNNASNNAPDAYLVNYADEQGFAILGATAGVAPIIAFVENGNVTWDDILNAGNTTRTESHQKEISPEQVLLMCVNGALYGHTEEIDTCSVVSPRLAPITSNLLFRQIRSYCLNSGHHFVVSGCGATALSIVVAHNNYPTFYADYELLNMSNCNVADGIGYYYYIDSKDLFLKKEDFFSNPLSIPSTLSNDQMLALLQKVDSSITLHGTPTMYYQNASFTRTRFKLTSSLFYLLNNDWISWGATGVIPSKVQTCMESLGYTNVHRIEDTTLSSGVILDMIDMLSDGKPVIMCGWSLPDLWNSHYWVVDGIKGSVNTAQIHCNWGWGGLYNGWFSRDCIRYTAGVTYDDPYTIGDSTTGNAWANLVTFTYDMQYTVPSVSIHNLYDNKVTY